MCVLCRGRMGVVRGHELVPGILEGACAMELREDGEPCVPPCRAVAEAGSRWAGTPVEEVTLLTISMTDLSLIRSCMYRLLLCTGCGLYEWHALIGNVIVSSVWLCFFNNDDSQKIYFQWIHISVLFWSRLLYMTETVQSTHDMMCSVVADCYKWCIIVMFTFGCPRSNKHAHNQLRHLLR